MNSELPDYLKQGEVARLFPVLAETSKEGRATSILLACLAHVKEFNRVVLGASGQRLGGTAKVRTYTEIVVDRREGGDIRPDGLIVTERRKGQEWRAFVEAKIGTANLQADQIAAYVQLAKAAGVDAIITISNEFTSDPSIHPLASAVKRSGKVQLIHWSWMNLLTMADLLMSNDGVEDRDQRVILSELIRFLTHPSAGIRGFDSMPAAWADLIQRVGAGAPVAPRDPDICEVVGAWHQEVRDLSLILSRQIGVAVAVRLSRTQASDPTARARADAAELAERLRLSVTLNVPDAAAPIDVALDLATRTIMVSMKLRAPEDRQSSKARVNWLLRQLKAANPEHLHLRLHWPGSGGPTQHALAAVLEDPDIALQDRKDRQVHSLEVVLSKPVGARFAQRRNIITELEQTVPQFYDVIGQTLRAYQPPAPRIREERADPGAVSPAHLQEQLTTNVED